jgi:hypothetical protein
MEELILLIPKPPHRGKKKGVNDPAHKGRGLKDKPTLTRGLTLVSK